MKIEHIAIWSEDIEILRKFYMKYFNATSNKKYTNDVKGFSSYFLSFDSGARIELMTSNRIEYPKKKNDQISTGIAHLAFSVGSEAKVNTLTSLLKTDGFKIKDGPRITGDGYYESVVIDPEGNCIEITI
jgi:lactoylglutathione lyase